MQRRIKYFARPGALIIGLLVVVILSSVLTVAQESQSSPDLPALKNYMLALINQSRSEAHLSTLQLDDLASNVAEKHCQEMLADNYLSHWNRAGAKPYLRYSRAGGTEAVMENVSAVRGGFYHTEKQLITVIANIHRSMIDERPPDDGHRTTILQPQHTHVGIGISFNNDGIRVAQEFIARHVTVSAVPKQHKAGKSFVLSGRILQKQHRLAGISLCYEPLPIALSITDLHKTKSYELPGDEKILRPRLHNQVYTDGEPGEIEFERSSGKFSTRVQLPQDRTGIYVIVVWLKQEDNSKFPATNICVEAIN